MSGKRGLTVRNGKIALPQREAEAQARAQAEEDEALARKQHEEQRRRQQYVQGCAAWRSLVADNAGRVAAGLAQGEHDCTPREIAQDAVSISEAIAREVWDAMPPEDLVPPYVPEAE